MTAVQNPHRAASAIRNHFEQTVLAEAGLSWTGFVVLWVTWIWDSLETRGVAEEAGTSKGTLTGVVKTLEGKGLVQRVPMPADGRLVLVQITDAGRDLMFRLFPQVNDAEVDTVSTLKPDEIGALAGWAGRPRSSGARAARVGHRDPLGEPASRSVSRPGGHVTFAASRSTRSCSPAT